MKSGPPSAPGSRFSWGVAKRFQDAFVSLRRAVKKDSGRVLPLPHTLARGNIYILPTRHGFLFLAVLLTMLAGSINYNNNLGFLFTFLLGSMVFVSLLHIHKNLAGIRIASIRARPVFKGETAMFDIAVQAGPVRRAAIAFTFGDTIHPVTDIVPGQDNLVRVAIGAARRGLLAAGPLCVSTKYPLGIFYAWSKLHTGACAIVYPAPRRGPLTASRIGAQHSEGTGDETMGVDDFKGLRSYQPGDPVSQISWRVFSKGQGVFVKEFKGEAASAPVFEMDRLKGKDTELKLSRLTWMVLEASRSGGPYGLKLHGNITGPATGEKHKLECLKNLALWNEKQRSTPL